MELTIKQTQAIDYLEDNSTTDLLFGGGAGGGKSAFGCYWQLKRRLKYPGTRGLIGRAVLKTLKDTTLNSFFQIASMQGLKANYHYIYNAQRGIINFPSNGSEILLKDLATYPSDPEFDELGSLEITDAFIDEANQISKKAYNITKSRIRYNLPGIPKMLCSCNPAKNWVYADFYKPSKTGEMPDHRKFIQALLSDNPYISEHYRNNLMQLDENSRQRLLYGNWEYDDDPSALISIDKIYECLTNVQAQHGQRYISADIARFGRDKTVIGVWDGLRLVKILVVAKNDIPEAIRIIRGLAAEYRIPMSNVIVDEDGVGGGVVDELRCVGFVNNSKAIENSVSLVPENFNNLKSQCYFKLAEKINNSEVYIVDSIYRDEIIQELEQVKQHDMDKDGKKKVLPKEDVKELIGRSPDFSDMLMMRMWFEVGVKFEFTIK